MIILADNQKRVLWCCVVKSGDPATPDKEAGGALSASAPCLIEERDD